MTDGGIKVLTALRTEPDTAWPISRLARAAGICRKKTRAAVMGSLLSGLVVEDTPDSIGINTNPPPHYRITEAGLQSLEDLGI